MFTKMSIESTPRDEIPTLNYYVTPVVVIVIGTYFVAHSFMGKSVRLLLLQ